MQEKDFTTYEYKTVAVKAKDQSKAMDMYEAFGWEITAVTSGAIAGVTLSLKRDRKQKHKQELNKLERQAEDVFDTLNAAGAYELLSEREGIAAAVYREARLPHAEHKLERLCKLFGANKSVVEQILDFMM